MNQAGREGQVFEGPSVAELLEGLKTLQDSAAKSALMMRGLKADLVRLAESVSDSRQTEIIKTRIAAQMLSVSPKSFRRKYVGSQIDPVEGSTQFFYRSEVLALKRAREAGML